MIGAKPRVRPRQPDAVVPGRAREGAWNKFAK